MRTSSALLTLALAWNAVALADTPDRRLPSHCVELTSGLPSTSWNDAYRQGLHAVEIGDLADAELWMCRALLAARDVDARDWRFAETLDELGLIAFSVRDYETAELVQGQAIAEMLLAVGPRGEPLLAAGTSSASPVRPDCRSGVAVYTTRLGWIHEKSPGRVDVRELADAPWRVFAAGYLPLDESLAGRLDWLVGRYLLEENVGAADDLIELQRRIRGER